MPIAIRSTADIAAKFIAVTPGRSPEYARGVQDSTVDWESPTLAAEGSYEEGVTAAIGRKAFGKGVTRSGNQKWRKGSIEKGTVRWPQGVAGALEAYTEGFAPFRDTIAGLTLPPRGPAGSPGNLQRVAAVANALHERKLSL